MTNELTEKEENVIAVIEEYELGSIIKPFIKEIFLLDSYVAGTTLLNDMSVLEEIKVGEVLSLQREENKYDSNAIIVFTEEGKKLGYIPEKENVIFARLMDAGKLLKAQITKIKQHGDYFKQINIGIYLVDF